MIKSKMQKSIQTVRPKISLAGMSTIFTLFKRDNKTSTSEKNYSNKSQQILEKQKTTKPTPKTKTKPIKEKIDESIEFKEISPHNVQSELIKFNKKVTHDRDKFLSEISNQIKELDAFKKKKDVFDMEMKKPLIPKDELEKLRMELMDRQREHKDDVRIIQDVQSSFRNVQNRLDYLKDELNTIREDSYQELNKRDNKLSEESAVKDKFLMETKPPIYVSHSEKIIDHRQLKHRFYGKRKDKLLKAQYLLKEFENRVGKLENYYHLV
jgi:hypothetical protein